MADILTAVQLIIKYSRNKRGKSGATAKVSSCKILNSPPLNTYKAQYLNTPSPKKRKTSLGSEHFSLLAKDTFLRFIGHSFLGHRSKHVPQWHFTCAMIKQRRQAQASNERSNFQLCFFHFVCFFLQCRHARQAGNIQYSDSTTGMDGWMDEDDDVDSIYMCVYLYIRGF